MTQMVTQKQDNFSLVLKKKKLSFLPFTSVIKPNRNSQCVLVTINSRKGTRFQNVNQKEAAILVRHVQPCGVHSVNIRVGGVAGAPKS